MNKRVIMLLLFVALCSTSCMVMFRTHDRELEPAASEGHDVLAQGAGLRGRPEEVRVATKNDGVKMFFHSVKIIFHPVILHESPGAFLTGHPSCLSRHAVCAMLWWLRG